MGVSSVYTSADLAAVRLLVRSLTCSRSPAKALQQQLVSKANGGRARRPHGAAECSLEGSLTVAAAILIFAELNGRGGTTSCCCQQEVQKLISLGCEYVS
jgi:hypothetical protein